ncbi:MAG: type II secretion system protein GspG [Pseudomonadota bacterium]|jgi:general secretion pathway protein G
MRDKIITILDPRRRSSARVAAGSSERGLTLIEIIVVLMMVGIIGAFVGGRVFKAGDRAKAELTRAKLNSLKEPIYMFQMRNNTLPSDLKTAEAEDTKDAWGKEVVYRVIDSGRSYELRSLGSDGREGGSGADADIVVTGP